MGKNFSLSFPTYISMSRTFPLLYYRLSSRVTGDPVSEVAADEVNKHPRRREGQIGRKFENERRN